MDLFRLARVVKLRSYKGTYLVAGEDGETIHLRENGLCRGARWTVECTIMGLHLRSSYGTYLAAPNHPADAGDAPVVQRLPDWRWLDPAVQWKPIGGQEACAMLRTPDGKFLGANPSENTVMHSWLSRLTTLDSMLWYVEIEEGMDNRGLTNEKLQVIALIVIGSVFIWFLHKAIRGLISLVNDAKTEIIILWGAVGILFQFLDFYGRITGFLRRFAR